MWGLCFKSLIGRWWYHIDSDCLTWWWHHPAVISGVQSTEAGQSKMSAYLQKFRPNIYKIHVAAGLTWCHSQAWTKEPPCLNSVWRIHARQCGSDLEFSSGLKVTLDFLLYWWGHHLASRQLAQFVSFGLEYSSIKHPSLIVLEVPFATFHCY